MSLFRKWPPAVQLLVTGWLAGLALTGCTVSTVSGVVQDMEGQGVPGVVVSVQGANAQDLTNAQGHYRVRTHPGAAVLEFFKSGYTPGRLEVEVPQGGGIESVPVRLWSLPTAKGVYFYEDHRYRSLRPLERETFLTEDMGVVYGTTKHLESGRGVVVTEDTLPTILCYNMPHRDVKLVRLEQEPLTLEETSRSELDVWIPADSIPVSLMRIDEPAGVLQEVRLHAPLAPGAYAVHWGALDSSSYLDPRLFTFQAEGELPEDWVETGEVEVEEGPEPEEPPAGEEEPPTPPAEDPEESAPQEEDGPSPANPSLDELELEMLLPDL